jgi:hypothetical protein
LRARRAKRSSVRAAAMKIVAVTRIIATVLIRVVSKLSSILRVLVRTTSKRYDLAL